MKTHDKLLTVLFAATIFLLAGSAGLVAAEKGMEGWESGSEYNQLYDPKERDSIRGHIKKFIKVTPMEGMAPGTAFLLDEGGGEMVTVHVCPEAFASPRETGLRPGEWVKIKGVWLDIDNETVFAAAKIKKDGGFSLKMRLTSDGTPFWTMSSEQLAAEMASQ